MAPTRAPARASAAAVNIGAKDELHSKSQEYNTWKYIIRESQRKIPLNYYLFEKSSFNTLFSKLLNYFC